MEALSRISTIAIPATTQPWANLLPPLGEDAMFALRADIKARGVQVPVEIDEDGVILDGHHRVRAANDFGLDYPTIVRVGMTDEEKVEHVVKLNVARRHMTSVERRTVGLALRSKLQWSSRRIADELGVSDTTVRRDLLASGATNVAPGGRVTGMDGKSYPGLGVARAKARLDGKRAERQAAFEELQATLGSDDLDGATENHWQTYVLRPLEAILRTSPALHVPHLSNKTLDRTVATFKDLRDWADLVAMLIKEADMAAIVGSSITAESAAEEVGTPRGLQAASPPRLQAVHPQLVANP